MNLVLNNYLLILLICADHPRLHDNGRGRVHSEGDGAGGGAQGEDVDEQAETGRVPDTVHGNGHGATADAGVRLRN